MIVRGPNSCLLGYLTELLLCFYVKVVVPSTLNLFDFWNSMSLIALDTEDIVLTEKNIFNEVGFFFDRSLQGFSFCPHKTFKPNKQTTRITSHLHWIVWSSGKLDYDKPFTVIYDIKVMNAEVFAKGIEKCRLLTRLVGQNVENLDDCPKFQDLFGEEKANSLLICSSYAFRQKTRLHCAESKAKLSAEWATQNLSL